MPQLMMVTACEKVILDRDSSSTSLINILEAIAVAAPPNVPIPPDLAIPLQWSVFSMWRRKPGDAEEYFQQLEIVLPDGQIALDQKSSFPLPAGTLGHKQTVKLTLLPVAQAGDIEVRLSLKPTGLDSEWARGGSCFISIKHVDPPSSP